MRTNQPRIKIFWITILLLSSAISACAKKDAEPAATTSAVAEYCPISPSATFSSAVTVSGTARYQYRYMGNGEVTDGTFYFKRTSSTTAPYTLTINGQTVTSNEVSAQNIANDLKTQIDGTAPLTGVVTATVVSDYYGDYAVQITPVDSTSLLTITNSTNNLTRDGGNPNPVRYAEVRALNSSGTIINCAETDANGQFTFQLPADSGSYTVVVSSRSNNTNNRAYVLNNPTNNQFHSISTTVATASNTSGLLLTASASGTLEGGAFNILDQILKAQEYLRAKTTSCSTSGQPTYFAGCVPYTVAPLLTVYWAPGVDPGSYFGISGASFYLMGRSQLYLLGGRNGDTDFSDMDHFDNSVILHEFGHFLEDQYADSDSPGGSHDGDSIIDPRLAWSEGWANFFQAAALESAVYRDTYGQVDHASATCSISNPCTGAFFNLDLDPSGTPTNDNPAVLGEGNFREFSVTRLLWDTIKSGGSRLFPELWAAFHGTGGLADVNDPFKSIGRLHLIQVGSVDSNKSDWASFATTENHLRNLTDYATPLTVGGSCTSSSVNMTVRKTTYDDGSFETSDLFRNNDFYRYDHAGGQLAVSLSWSAADRVDLDLFIYRSDYAFGDTSTMAGASDASSNSTTGTESLSGTLAAGTYMINIKADTSLYCFSASNCTNSVSGILATYALSINSTPACPSP